MAAEFDALHADGHTPPLQHQNSESSSAGFTGVAGF
jgi:hypothetical protein